MAPILLLLFGTFIASVSAGVDCNVYKRLESQVHCNETGYLVGYGYKYCNRFMTTMGEFTPEGRNWVTCTGNCLIQRIQPIVQANLNVGKLACNNIKTQAFTSHPQCYTSCGFCKIQKDKQNLKALYHTYDIGTFFSAEALSQVVQVEKTCLL